MIKRVFKIEVVLFFLVLLFVQCEDDTINSVEKEQRLLDSYISAYYPDAVPDENGIYFFEKNSGSNIVVSDTGFVVINYTLRTIDNNVIYTTSIDTAYKYDLYTSSQLYDATLDTITDLIDGIQLGLLKIGEGGSFRSIIPSKYAYGTSNNSSLSTIIADVELLKVVPYPKVYEQNQIDTYVNTNGVNVEPDSTGFYFIEKVRGDGYYYPKSGHTVKVYYTGRYADGRQFDSNIGGATLDFKIGAGSVVSGFNKGVSMMKEGGKAQIIIPSEQGYGYEKNRSIPPYSTLIFDLYLVSVDSVSVAE